MLELDPLRPECPTITSINDIIDEKKILFLDIYSTIRFFLFGNSKSLCFLASCCFYCDSSILNFWNAIFRILGCIKGGPVIVNSDSQNKSPRETIFQYLYYYSI